jgi:hypothetical protein
MEQLASQAWRLTLVIDTPIAFNRKELAVVTPLLQKFRRVAVAEDYMNFPHFALIRKVVREGLIGKPLAATLYNVGYAYHGLALIRSFVGFRSAIRSWRNPVGAFGRHVNYRFADGFRAFVIGPYRREGNGGIIVEGSRGVITEVASDRIGGDPMHRPIFRISKIYHNDFVSGFSVDDGARRLDRIDNPEIAMMREMDFADKSEFNLLKCCGLIAVFRSLIEPDPINSNYGYPNALYDSFAARLADRGRLIFDPLVLIRKNLMIGVHAVSRILSSASRLKGARGISS